MAQGMPQLDFKNPLTTSQVVWGVLIFIVLLTLSVAAPRVAKQMQHDKEQESERRAEQYVRAVRIYYLKFKRYPTSIEQLEKTNNQRFLRQAEAIAA